MTIKISNVHMNYVIIYHLDVINVIQELILLNVKKIKLSDIKLAFPLSTVVFKN